MRSPRTGLLATGLANGNVLVLGGDAEQISDQLPVPFAEVYNATSRSWSPTPDPSVTPYNGSTLTLLASGKVLLAGGSDINGQFLASAEVYNPTSGTWEPTGSLHTARIGHTATLLPSGEVLVAGGEDASGVLASAEVYNPATGVWSLTGNPNSARIGDTATLLPSGKVMVAGGRTNNSGTGSTVSAELYDPTTGKWSPTGSLAAPFRGTATATLLASGKVLIVNIDANSGFGQTSAQLYDPASGTWTSTGSLVTGARTDHTATLLADGSVLVAGGVGEQTFSGVSYLSTIFVTTELYHPTTGTWSRTGDLVESRTNHTATLLNNGSVLVAGGSTLLSEPPPPTNSAELYTPPTTTQSPSSCVLSGSGKDTAGRSFISIAARDIASGLKSVHLVQSSNTTVALPSFPNGSRDPAVVRATKIDQTQRSTVTLSVTNTAGQSLTCDPVIADLVHQPGKPAFEIFDELPAAESKLTLTNGEPGFHEMTVLVNGRLFRLSDLRAGETRSLDVARAMHPGSTNTILVLPRGPRDSTAELVISD